MHFTNRQFLNPSLICIGLKPQYTRWYHGQPSINSIPINSIVKTNAEQSDPCRATSSDIWLCWSSAIGLTHNWKFTGQNPQEILAHFKRQMSKVQSSLVFTCWFYFQASGSIKPFSPAPKLNGRCQGLRNTPPCFFRHCSVAYVLTAIGCIKSSWRDRLNLKGNWGACTPCSAGKVWSIHLRNASSEACYLS